MSEILYIHKWKEAVLKKDKYTCQHCGSKENLEADHIKSVSHYPELRLDLNNGRALCNPCHKKTPTYAGKSNKGRTYISPKPNQEVLKRVKEIIKRIKEKYPEKFK